MYGWMAVATFAIFGHELPKNGPVFWFMMQIAMLDRVPDGLPGELVAGAQRHQGENVTARVRPGCGREE